MSRIRIDDLDVNADLGLADQSKVTGGDTAGHSSATLGVLNSGGLKLATLPGLSAGGTNPWGGFYVVPNPPPTSGTLT